MMGQDLQQCLFTRKGRTIDGDDIEDETIAAYDDKMSGKFNTL